MKRQWIVIASVLIGLAAARASAQLPPEAVNLGKLKIAEKQKSEDLDPVYLVPSDPSGPAWEYKGVKYRGAKPDSKDKFMAAPDKFAEAAAKERWTLNFIQAMSKIWCPVTDEVTPGGLQQWTVDGIIWESCCTFCDTTVKDEDFGTALERLKARAGKSYELTGGKYVEGAKSPVDGAIDENAKPTEGHDHEGGSAPKPSAEPAWLAGKDLKPTYTGGAALIIENRCLSCHRPGEIAPMSFMTYNDVRKWTKSFKNSVASRSMPPSPGEGDFFGSARLTDKELGLLTAWADAGFPAGDGQYKPERQWVAGWNIGKPDAIFDLPDYTVAEKTTGEIKEFTLETKLDKDQWIVASEVRTADIPAVVQIDAGPLAQYNLGCGPDFLAPGQGRLLKAGEKVTVRVLYQKEAGFALPVSGVKIGVLFAKDPSTIKIAEQFNPMAASAFKIPAKAEAFETKASFEAPAEASLLSIQPVMGLRGKDAKVTLLSPDGKRQDLLSISKWQPDWRLRYRFAEPIKIAKGTRVELTAKFDNSITNVKNPNPNAEVSSGPDGETLQGWVGYALIP